tara:strand:+ start:8954 stop:9148 length:195 start_codon:yes stop_codon:yes gene_type:complete
MELNTQQLVEADREVKAPTRQQRRRHETLKGRQSRTMVKADLGRTAKGGSASINSVLDAIRLIQ